MPEPEQPMTSTEKRIVDEWTFIADRILRMEEPLRKILFRLEGGVEKS